MNKSTDYSAADGDKFVSPWWSQEDVQFSMGASRAALRRDFQEYCNDFLEQRVASESFKLATLWSVDPVDCTLILLGAKGVTVKDLREPILDYTKNLSGLAVESRDVMSFEDVGEERQDGRSFSHYHLIKELGLKSMICIPILNTCNINQVLMVLNLFPVADQINDIWEFSRFGDSLAVRFETFLRERCVRFANRLGIDMGAKKKRSPERIYREVVGLVREAVRADFVSIYVERPDSESIECQSATGAGGQAMHDAELDELANRCWRANREKLTISVEDDPAAQYVEYRELLPPRVVFGERMRSELFVPLRDLAGRGRGSFCCLKTTKYAGSEVLFPFTYEDVAVIEGIGQAFAPQLEIIVAEVRRTDAMNKLAHELRWPVVALGAALERVERECREYQYTFKHDYFDELKTYCDAMNRLLLEVDVVRKGPQFIPLVTRRTYFEKGIIAPAVRFLRPLLVKRKLSSEKIKYLNLRRVPELYVDPALMTQVVFNLLDNAIKYFHGEAHDFQIEIEGNDTGSNFEVLFRDNGVGIPQGWSERIFESGIRGPNAHQYDVAGEGLGLWFGREIVRRHGGDLILRKQKDPTTFVIILPGYLKERAPDESETKE